MVPRVRSTGDPRFAQPNAVERGLLLGTVPAAIEAVVGLEREVELDLAAKDTRMLGKPVDKPVEISGLPLLLKEEELMEDQVDGRVEVGTHLGISREVVFGRDPLTVRQRSP